MIYLPGVGRHNSDNMLCNMEGPIFVAITRVLEIKPCKTNCLKSLKNRRFRSIKDLVMKLSAKASPREQRAVRDRFLMCCYFYKQSIILDWTAFAYNMTEGTICAELQELFDQWLHQNHRRATTLFRAVVLALRANPSLTCEQVSFCFDPLPRPLVTDTVNLLYRLLLASCAKVNIKDNPIGSKTLSVRYT